MTLYLKSFVELIIAVTWVTCISAYQQLHIIPPYQPYQPVQPNHQFQPSFPPAATTNHPAECQTYTTNIHYGQVYFQCISYTNKIGECPRNTTDYPNIHNFGGIYCYGDWNCPSGFKCCKDERVPYYSICKPAFFNSSATSDSIDSKTRADSRAADNNKPLNRNSNKPNSKPAGNGNGNKNYDNDNDDKLGRVLPDPQAN